MFRVPLIQVFTILVFSTFVCIRMCLQTFQFQKKFYGDIPNPCMEEADPLLGPPISRGSVQECKCHRCSNIYV